MNSFEELIRSVGFLTDGQINRALENGYLMERGTWDGSQVRHASYTLRLGDKVEIFRAAASLTSENRELTIVRLTKDDPRIEIRPGDTALLYSSENLRFPHTVLGFTVARGLLFAEALCPENTYVDPGWSGHIYTTVTNVSGRVIHLEYNTPIARLFFFRLSEPVMDGYRTGPALGISQQLKSVRTTPLSSPAECHSASDSQLLEGVRLIPIGGIHTAEALQRLKGRHRRAEVRLWIAVFVWPILLVIANTSKWVTSSIGTFVASVVSSIVAALLMILGGRVFDWFRSE